MSNDKPRQPSPEPCDPNAIIQREREWLEDVERKLSEPKPTQSADTSERDAAAEAFATFESEGKIYVGHVKFEAYVRGWDAHAAATEGLRAKLDTLAHIEGMLIVSDRKYKRAVDELEQERQRAAGLCKALEGIRAMAQVANAYGAMRQIAQAALAAHGRGAGE